MQFFEQKKGAKLNKYKSSMMKRIDRSILTMRGEHKSILESLRNGNTDGNGNDNEKDTKGDDDTPGAFGLSKRVKGLKV